MRNKVTTRWEFMFVVISMTAVTTISVYGQIRIPKILKPKENPPVQIPTPQNPQPQTPTRPPGTRPGTEQAETISETGGNFLDDGYTWFEAVSTEELSAQHRPVTTGWVLKSEIRLIGDYPRQSALKVNVSRAGQVLGTTRCEAFQYKKDASHLKVSSLVTIACFDKTKTIKELGKFDVEVFAINGATDAESSVRKYKIEVLKVDRIGGGFSNPQPDAPHYYISRHAEAPVSFLFLRPKNVYSYIGYDERSPVLDMNTVEIYFSLSPSDERVRDGYLSCDVDGRHLELPGGQPYSDKTDINTERHYEEIYTDRLAAQYKAGTPYRDEIRFTFVRMVLPLTFGDDRNHSRVTMKDHPGNWQCSLMASGETWRTWRWKVGPDGMLVKHAEQNGNINLSYNTYLIDMEIPAGGSKLDKRLAPTSATDGLFYGQPWTTPEGRAMAAKVSTKGKPAPIPSNQVK